MTNKNIFSHKKMSFKNVFMSFEEEIKKQEIKKLKRYLIRAYNFKENDIKDVGIQEDTAVVKRYSAFYNEIVTCNFRLTFNKNNKIVAVNGFKLF